MLQIEPIAAFDDNYIWLLSAPPASTVVVVDPGDADPVIATLRARGLSLAGVLITHHHQDHIGGLAELAAVWPDLIAIGPADRRIRGLTRVVGDGDRVGPDAFGIDLGVGFSVLTVPGHTATHIAYLSDDGALFCGDTLFAAGCGRVFDGSFEDLAASLRRIAALPGDTRCYCAHEYTLANLGFARWVEPASPALDARCRDAEALRAAGQPTVPSTLALELATNPFLRTNKPAVIAAAEGFAGTRLPDQTAVFTALRRWKDERYD